MIQKMKIFFLFILFTVLFSCQTKPVADLVFTGGNIYTAQDSFPRVEVVAVGDGRIVYAGTEAGLSPFVNDNTKRFDLEGRTMTPGFIDAHAHLLGVGYSLIYLNLTHTANYDEMVAMVKDAVSKAKPGEWILGRGWHQSKWNPKPKKRVRGFQTHEKLSAVSPDNPVFLTHASGHAVMVNAKAMEIAGIDKNSPNPDGGEILRDPSGYATGIFTDEAKDNISDYIPLKTREMKQKALDTAVANLLENGITGFCTAGGDSSDIALFKDYAKSGKLKIRLYVMLTGTDSSLIKHWLSNGPEVGLSNDHLTIRAIKMYADGALGTRTAWLLEPYSDRSDYYGEAVSPMVSVAAIADKALKHGFQLGTHAIGDRGNREILDIYEQAFREHSEVLDPRFRIEHAQHLNAADIPRFGQLGVLPLMQTIHMASDMSWAIDRLGAERIAEGAYVWQKLIKSGARIANGTDAPVEPVDPIANFYAAVARKTLKGEQEDWFHPEQQMTREQALQSYTINAAYSQFAEKDRGTIEVGKWADFTVFSKDIMTIPEEEILNTRVEATIVGGEVLYQK